MNLVRKAVRIACEYHGDQKYGRHPYIVHLIDVATLLWPFGEIAEVCGYLHDIIEDTDYPAGQLGIVFGREVREVIEAVTDPKAGNRKMRKAAANQKLCLIDAGDRLSLALIVKAADRLANVRACIEDGNHDLLKMYRNEHAAFFDAVHRPFHGCVALLEETSRLLSVPSNSTETQEKDQ